MKFAYTLKYLSFMSIFFQFLNQPLPILLLLHLLPNVIAIVTIIIFILTIFLRTYLSFFLLRIELLFFG